VAVVPENDVGAGDFFFERELCGEDGLDQIVVPAIARFKSCDLCIAAGRYGDCLVLAEIETVFEEERDIRKEAPQPLCSGFLFEIKTFLADAGVENVFEGMAFFEISEDFQSEFFADDFSVIGIEDVATEGFSDFGDDFRGLEEGFDGGIAIEYDYVREQFLEEADSG